MIKKVSIIIVTWNSAIHILHCLESLRNQTFQNFEIIIVDNGSSDNAINNLRSIWPSLDIKIEKLDSNKGFAIANNIGANLAEGKWLALLNADAFPLPTWLEHLLRAAEKYPNSFFASQQIQANSPSILDGEGDTYHVSGLAWRRSYGLPISKNKIDEEVFSTCAAAALYPRKEFLEVGGFDEDYFSYHEDVDLSFRLRLHGLAGYYIPKAIVHHVGSASTGKMSDFSVYYGHRNLVWTFIKNMPLPLFWIYLPLHVMINFYFLFSFTVRGRGRVIWKAKIDTLSGLVKVLIKRKKIQLNRKASTKDIYLALDNNLFSPLLVFIQRRRSQKGKE
jgi:GT2 family glycosyltransferase